MLSMGVVGVGHMGQLHARTIAESESARLVAVVDPDAVTGRQVADRYGISYFSDVSAALADTRIDAYVVAVPDRLHVEPSCALLLAGKPVLLEKPMAHSLASAREIAQAAAHGGARLMVGHICRLDPRYRGAAQAVADGLIGEPIHAMAGRISSRVVGTRMNGTSSVLFYLGVHDADAIQWVTGRSIRRVYSRAASKLMPSLGVESEDVILSLVEFEDGTIGQLFNGWTRTVTDPVGVGGRLEVHGTEGIVEIDVRDNGLRIYGRDGLAVPDAVYWPEVNGRIGGALAAQVRHFAHAVLEGSPFVMSVPDAMRAVAVNDAILRSVESGKPENVETVALDLPAGQKRTIRAKSEVSGG
jgi:predicted dehydrogenase